MHDYFTSPEIEQQLAYDVAQAAQNTADATPHTEIEIPRIKPGLMAMGEVDEQDSGEDEEFEGDDITSLAHGELEQHREMREYARIAAWEMPLLSSAFASCLIYFSGTKLHYRASKAIHPSNPRLPPPLPLHNLHGRIPPRRKENRP